MTHPDRSKRITAASSSALAPGVGGSPDSPPLLSRRALLHAGLGAAGLGLLGVGAARPLGVLRSVAAAAHPAGVAASDGVGAPILDLASTLRSTIVDGLPFAEGWTGDSFSDDALPFHQCENCFEGGVPPAPSEEVDVAIVGGGLAGLATAHALRHRRIALLEMRDRMGGVAAGERWRGTACSLGSAYFIVPDPGSELERLYREIGLWGGEGPSIAEGALSAEIDGAIVRDILEWEGFTAQERSVVRRYAELVRFFGHEYPEIPVPKRPEARWILELDRASLRDDVEHRLGGPLPQRLAEAIQAYCYSSFGVGWQEISAAAGWNFIAAEEFGRIVLPGGNAGLAEGLWRSLRAAERTERRSILRPASKVVDVRLDGAGVRVTWSTGRPTKEAPFGTFRSLRARHVVMANAKFVAKWMLPELPRLDAEKFEAMQQVTTCAYAVVNVLVERAAARRFYDLFLLGGDGFPMDQGAAEKAIKVMDVLDGGYGASAAGEGGSTILTLYWALPWPSARFALIGPAAWQEHAAALAPQLREIVALIGVDERSIHQIRMSRWGHAMPIPAPNAIADGLPEKLRRPIAGRIWFANQDNWLLPAVETSLLEALDVAASIDAG
ncbi:MAG TPA: FAD-dependent oxidoreductase [Phycisphaerales bacterium]|nr:FAD-dependent oxidoreductase [Phycisphaerales bacterium]HMP35914.1 FAD-dependent oxidoreductase [Phycisphaerales bacterium]